MTALQSGRASAETLAGMGANPVYQQIQLQMNQADVEIASLRSELGVRQQKIAQLRSMLDTAPEVEAEFARLNRDYDVIKARYNELVNRLDRAEISEAGRTDRRRALRGDRSAQRATRAGRARPSATAGDGAARRRWPAGSAWPARPPAAADVHQQRAPSPT